MTPDEDQRGVAIHESFILNAASLSKLAHVVTNRILDKRSGPACARQSILAIKHVSDQHSEVSNIEQRA